MGLKALNLDGIPQGVTELYKGTLGRDQEDEAEPVRKVERTASKKGGEAASVAPRGQTRFEAGNRNPLGKCCREDRPQEGGWPARPTGTPGEPLQCTVQVDTRGGQVKGPRGEKRKICNKAGAWKQGDSGGCCGTWYAGANAPGGGEPDHAGQGKVGRLEQRSGAGSGNGAGAREAPRQAPAGKHSLRDAGPRRDLGKFSSTWFCFSNRKQAWGEDGRGEGKGSRLEEFEAFRQGRGASWARDHRPQSHPAAREQRRVKQVCSGEVAPGRNGQGG